MLLCTDGGRLSGAGLESKGKLSLLTTLLPACMRSFYPNDNQFSNWGSYNLLEF